MRARGLVLLGGLLSGLGVAGVAVSLHLRQISPAPSPAQLAGPVATATDVAVIRAVLLYRQELAEQKEALVFVRDTHPFQDFGMAARLGDLRIDGLRPALKKRNRKSTAVPDFDFRAPLVFADVKKVDAALKRGWWNEFYRQYPGTRGMVRFSLPGFAADGRTAVVYSSLRSGGRSGMGAMYYLEMLDGKWEVQQQADLWAS